MPAEDPLDRRGRRVRRARTPVAAAAALLVLAAALPFTVGDDAPALRLTARAVANELGGCLLRGEPPAPQTYLAEQHRRMRPRRWEPPPEPVQPIPVVDPAEVAGIPLPLRDPGLPRSGPVVVAVVDSGVDPQLAGIPDHAVLAGADLLNPCGDGRQDVTGHGSSVAAVLLAGAGGVASQVRILPVRVSTPTGRHNGAVLAAGIAWAAAQGADVINVSLARQSGGYSHVERAAVRFATQRGAVVVAAAGNDPTRRAGYPAAYPEVLSVTSVTGDGHLSAFAARTGAIDIAAPGSRVIVAHRGGRPEVASGTSVAAPLVSATVTRMLAIDPGLHAGRIAAVLRSAREEEDAPDVAAERRLPFPSLDARSTLLAVCAASPQCVLREVAAPEESVPDADRDEPPARR